MRRCCQISIFVVSLVLAGSVYSDLAANSGEGRATCLLEGNWTWIEDSSGELAHEHASCNLDFQLSPEEALILDCFKAGKYLEDRGGWFAVGVSKEGGTLTLELSGMGIKVDKGSFSFEDDVLRLPFKLIGQGKGYSKWKKRKQANPWDFVATAYDTYNRELEAGADHDTAAKNAAESIRTRKFPSETIRVTSTRAATRAFFAPAPPPAMARLAVVVLNQTKTSIMVQHKKGDRPIYILLRSKPTVDRQ